MKALKINSEDSLSIEAAWSAGLLNADREVSGFVAVPDALDHANHVETVACKHGSSFVRLRFPDGTSIRILKFSDEDPEAAIQEARESLEDAGVQENDIKWWEDFR